MKLSRSKGMASMLAVLGLFVFAMAAPAFADSYSVDVSSATFGFSTPVTTQYASDGITFDAETTGGLFYAPATGSTDWQDTDPIDGVVSGLSNSPSGNYPTTEFLDINFTNPASGVSFWYDNFGGEPAGSGDSFYTAYNALDEVVSTGNLSAYTAGFNPVTVTGSGISEIVIDNNTPDTFSSEEGESWEFGVTRVDYTEGATSSVPEPSSLALLAFGMLGLLVVSKKLKITTNAA